MLIEQIGEDQAKGKSHMKLVQIYRRNKMNMIERHYKHFYEVSQKSQQYLEQESCIGPYFIDFGLNPGRIQNPTKNKEVIYLQALVEDLVHAQFKYKQQNKVIKQNEHEKIFEQM